MNEADLKGDLRDGLKIKSIFTLRFEDRFTSGIPDMLIGGKGHGFWVEAKLDDNLEHPWKWKTLKMQQVVFNLQLETSVGLPSYFLCYSVQRRQCVFIETRYLLTCVREQSAIPAGFVYAGKGLQQILQTLERQTP